MLLHGPGSVEVERLLTSMRVGGRAGDQKLRGDARAGQQEIRSSGGDERAGNRAARGLSETMIRARKHVSAHHVFGCVDHHLAP
jgi:hypothetical protein